MINIVDEFYRSRAEQPYAQIRDRLLLSSSDFVVSERGSPGSLFVRTTVAKILALNAVEFFKSILKSRLPVYRHASVVQLAFGEAIYCNLINGTVVIIGHQDVWKFFFKDISYFTELYRTVAAFSCFETFTGANFVAIRQPLHKVGGAQNDVLKVLLLIKPSLDHYHSRQPAPGTDDIFSPGQKVKQIALFHNKETHPSIADYVYLAQALMTKSAKFENVLCHGDVWMDNILKDQSALPVLIDFDKTVCFNRSYDFVYFFLMTNILPHKIHIESVLEDLDYYAAAAISFLNIDCNGKLGTFSVEEIKGSVFLFSLLKLVESDLRQATYGKSSRLLHTALEAI